MTHFPIRWFDMEIKTAEFTKSIRGTDPIITERKRQVAFVGRSNAGKSSLMNCLLNRTDLVRSGKTPGKTQEINFFLVNNSFYFVDLPGYGFAKMSLDRREQLAKMIQWFLLEEVYDRTVVLVLDIKVGPSDMDLEMLRILSESNNDTLVVLNKSDKLNQRERHEQIKRIALQVPEGVDMIVCSAKTKEGREEILKRVVG
ncbi:MAG: EngB [Candidatus Parcubacteria bacterium]